MLVKTLFLLVALLSLVQAQQICLSQECPVQVKACDA